MVLTKIPMILPLKVFTIYISFHYLDRRLRFANSLLRLPSREPVLKSCENLMRHSETNLHTMAETLLGFRVHGITKI